MKHLVEVYSTKDLAHVAGLVPEASLVVAAITEPIASHISFLQTTETTGRRLIMTVPARRILQESELELLYRRLDANPDIDLMLVAGNDESSGIFEDSMGLLYHMWDSGRLQGRHLYFAAHPEGTIESTSDVLLAAMSEKERFCVEHQLASTFVSQLCIVASLYGKWLRHVRASGIRSPIICGLSTSCTQAQLISRLRFCYRMRKMRMVESYHQADMMLGDFDPVEYVRELQSTVGLKNHGVNGYYWCGFDTLSQVEDDVKRLTEADLPLSAAG